MSEDIIKSEVVDGKLIVDTATGTEEYDSQFLVAALLVYIARAGGEIAPAESARMIDLLEEHFQLQGAESLELITRAMNEMADKPQLIPLLISLAQSLAESEKEEIALMALKVIAADGRRDFAEMEQFDRAMEAAGVSPETVHRAFDQYFSETMPGI
jgi:uncharacterized tellurite resistance protein B-like protein